MPEVGSRYLIDNNLFIAATKTGWKRSTDLLVHLLDSPIELIGNEVLYFEYEKWAKIIGAHDLFNYLNRRVIINNPIEGEISQCAPFFDESQFADMIHAATCLGTRAIIITNDKHFDEIKRASLIEVWSINYAIKILNPSVNPP